MSIVPIEEALAEVRAGRPIIVVDDEDRENEGDLTVAAENATPKIINFMARYGRGLVCAPLDSSFFEKMKIPLMVASSDNRSKFGTSFGISVGAADGITTGISAQDRAHTVQVLIHDLSTPNDITMPGHIFPLRACSGGVLERAGHTEAAVDLARLAGLKPAGVICEILKQDGSMARLPDLLQFASEQNLKVTSIENLIAFRRLNAGD